MNLIIRYLSIDVAQPFVHSLFISFLSFFLRWYSLFSFYPKRLGAGVHRHLLQWTQKPIYNVVIIGSLYIEYLRTKIENKMKMY